MVSDTDDAIQAELDGDVFRITLNRPEVRNAQTPQMWNRLAELARGVPGEARFVVLAGTGVDFSAGLDRGVFADTGPEGMIAALQKDPSAFIAAAQQAFRAWTRIPQTVIATVQGNVIGAGFQLALASDIIIATSNARFALRETSIGLIPDLGGTGALIDALGYRRTFALCATGDFLSALDAHSCGLVHLIDDDLGAASAGLLEQLRGINTGALFHLKELLRDVARDQDSWDAEKAIQVRRLAALFSSSTA